MLQYGDFGGNFISMSINLNIYFLNKAAIF